MLVRMFRLLNLRNGLRNERGQALFIIAGAFLALLVVVGIVVDLAVIYVHNGHLRRAVDSAAVAAVSQYREGRRIGQIDAAAKEFLQFQLPGVHNIRTYWCSRDGPGVDTVTDVKGDNYDPHDSNLCSTPRSKRVRVEAWLDVDLVFLSLVGFNQVRLSGWTESEAAVVNMVLLLDTSASMAYGVGGSDPNACPPTGYPHTVRGEEYPSFAECLKACSGRLEDGTFSPDPNDYWCSPFEEVRKSAVKFMANMCDGVDHVAVYHFDKTPVLTQSVSVEYYTVLSGTVPVTVTVPVTIYPSSGIVISLTSDIDQVTTDIEDNSKLHIYVPPPHPDPGSTYSVGGFRWTNTNIGGGLREAKDELLDHGNRDIAVWIIVLLTDGAANATDKAADENGWWTCPSPPGQGPDERTIQPFCRDPEDDGVVTRHCPSLETCSDPSRIWYTNLGETITTTIMWNYDADDYARDMADDASAQMIAIYTIGFGKSVYNYTGGGRNDAGERLLRYIADVGDDGSIYTAPCGSAYYWDAGGKSPPAQGEQCGNYYYAEAANLNDVFASISSRLFSRISK